MWTYSKIKHKNNINLNLFFFILNGYTGKKLIKSKTRSIINEIYSYLLPIYLAKALRKYMRKTSMYMRKKGSIKLLS